jgi:hypothetical protein
MRFRAAFVSKVPMKTTHSNKRSIKQNSNRLAAYLATGIGAGIVATPVADAAIVTIDITDTGFDLDGPNAGLILGPSSYTFKENFPIFGGGAIFAANIIDPPASPKGIGGHMGLSFAAGSAFASPVKFTPTQSIDSSANWPSGGGPSSYFFL